MLYHNAAVDYPDGLHVRCRINNYNNRPRLVFIHGLSSRLEMYEYMFAYCDEADIACSMIELRGHGESGGSLEDSSYFQNCVKDLKRFLFGHLKNESVYLAAEGPGAFLIPYILKDPRFNVEGEIFISPLLDLSLSMTEKIVVQLSSLLLPSLPLSLRQGYALAMCDDPESLQLFEGTGALYSPVFMRSILSEQRSFRQFASILRRHPVYALAGLEDCLVPEKRRKSCIDLICAKNELAECVYVKKGCHHLLLGKQRIDILADILKWINRCERMKSAATQP